LQAQANKAVQQERSKFVLIYKSGQTFTVGQIGVVQGTEDILWRLF
jgi:hypothetical protein